MGCENKEVLRFSSWWRSKAQITQQKTRNPLTKRNSLRARMFGCDWLACSAC